MAAAYYLVLHLLLLVGKATYVLLKVGQPVGWGDFHALFRDQQTKLAVDFGKTAADEDKAF